MHVQFVPFKADHVATLRARHPDDIPDVPMALARSLEVPGLAWSCLVDGDMVGSAGVAPEVPWRGVGWCIVRRDVPMRAWPAITRRARDVLAAAHLSGLQRIACFVDVRFGRGLVWARKLGFEPDGIARGYQPDRGDAVIYSRVA